MLTMEQLEAAVIRLEEENKAMKLELDRVAAVNDIQRLMGDYLNTHVANPNEPINHFNQWIYFADRDDTTYEVANFGLLKGYKNVQFFFKEKKEMMEGQTGIMFEHDLASPQIVVAGDGKTARGVWTSPGHETIRERDDPSKMRPEWAWGRIAADFIKIDGMWKIWHYHWYRLFRTPFGTPWTETDQQGVSRPIPAEHVLKYGGEPDKVFPSTYFHPYSPDTYVECQPRTPKPYDSWETANLPPV